MMESLWSQYGGKLMCGPQIYVFQIQFPIKLAMRMSSRATGSSAPVGHADAHGTSSHITQAVEMRCTHNTRQRGQKWGTV